MTRIIAATATLAALITLGAVMWAPARSGDSPTDESSTVGGTVAPTTTRPLIWNPPDSTEAGSPPTSSSPPEPEPCEHWVSPDGDDDASGSASDPWASLEHAARVVPDVGCTVWFESGVYTGTQQIKRRFEHLTVFRSVEDYGAVLEHDDVVIDVDGARNVIIEGFEMRHSDPSSSTYVVNVDQGDGRWAENVVLRNNIIHDSYDNDLLKIHNGVRQAVVEGNLFFNQGPAEQHIDINSVTDVVVQDNIFFNDYEASGRPIEDTAKHFIMVKDSNEDADGLLGAQRITLRRNVFLNFEGGREMFVKIGNDGKPYHEADTVDVVNNLMIGNSPYEVRSPFGIAGARNVTFAHNTIVGDLPARRHGFDLDIKGDNPANENISLLNNIWSDPTESMSSFSRGSSTQVDGLELANNLYWNGGAIPPDGELVDPYDDPRAVFGDPHLPVDQSSVLLPHWDGSSFPSGNPTIRDEFVRLVEAYGRPGDSSSARGRGSAATPPDDILGRLRGSFPEIGAYEIDPVPGGGTCPSVGTPFVDVAEASELSEAVRWLACEGIAASESEAFGPDEAVTRADFAAFLWRFTGRPESSSITRFSDVAPGRYFTEAVAWLDAAGLTTGTGLTTFSPELPVTRGQAAVLLWDYAGQPPPASTTPSFADVPAGAHYSAAVAWLEGADLTTGSGPTTFSPDQPLTRLEMGALLWRLAGSPEV